MSGPGSRDLEALRGRWHQYRDANPKVRIRDAALELGVSEAELVWTGVDARVKRLRPEWKTLLEGLDRLGKLTALTRNESAVHEKHGIYRPVEVHPAHALVLGTDIDLRLFPRAWGFAFHLEQAIDGGIRHSIQIFDRAGTAVHKMFSTPETDLAAFASLASDLAMADAPAALDLEPASAPPLPERLDAQVDVAGLRDAWAALQDTHDFYALLGRFRVSRTQALRLAAPDLAKPVSPASLRAVLTTASERAVPIMVFVGNHGALQIHSGEVQRIAPMGPWINVLDPGFSLHVREDHLDRAWVVRKPTRDGFVTALELYDRAGELIVQLFGRRKPGLPELETWRTALSDATAGLTTAGA